MGKHHELIVDLRRNSPNEPWGFSLVGGADVKTPLIVTRVAFGSPAQGGLQRGDIITKVGNYDSRDIRHEDAQNLFRNAGSNVRLVVQRETAPRQNASTGSSRNSSHYSPLSVSPNLSPRGPGLSPGYSPAGSALTPVYTSPLTPIDNNYFEPYEYGQRKRDGNEDGEVHVMKQVANTVLERITTGDPNKQLVHKQFNSPINVYSEPNILDTIHRQTGVQAPKRHVKFNPAESATYQYLQEEEMGGYGAPVQEVVTPPQSKIYTPTKKAANVVNTNNPQYLNAIGQDPEVIQQSGSFKRLMMSVLPGSNF
ncbi:PDZ and LIM domain protein Zasp isoform X6 [Anthonomus grandis grandis]|uniref:PDZ and LIM domain protein Zasp isoform X6 n=1 Tax=Anthonomus grandis grandis TaxID=2921223 RepID=UPI002165338A|nr:PDZ and LIM domain protein Zasp isoform X6 [Anthonomus grandis grandis]